MMKLQVPSAAEAYERQKDMIVFHQLAIQIEMDSVSNEDYFDWLDRMKELLPRFVGGAEIVERAHARSAPPRSTSVYYDTPDHRLADTGALIRTSSARATHASCAYEAARDDRGVRRDHRYLFEGEEKLALQEDPSSAAAVDAVKRLLLRTDIEHPGTILERHHGIRGQSLEPAIRGDTQRFTFSVWLDGEDALRCSLDRARVSNLRLPVRAREQRPVGEVEIAIHPRISPAIAADERVTQVFGLLGGALCRTFRVGVTTQTRYQRAAGVLGVAAGS